MVKISDIYKFLCEIAPLELQMSFDNSGFQIGKMNGEAKKVLLALDVTDYVVDEAIHLGAELIVSHHPLIFHALKSITDQSVEGRRVLKLIENGISVISMHTNLDVASGGVNDVLMQTLEVEPEAALDSAGCGRIGKLEAPLELEDFLNICRTKLKTNVIRYYNAGKKVEKLAVMGGAGGDCLQDVFERGCDTYVTSDIKYHQFLLAAEMGINLIDADHFCTENPVIYELEKKITESFPDIDVYVSRTHGQIIKGLS